MAKRKKTINNVKRSNKHFSKLQKQGKLKKKRKFPKTFNSNNGENINHEEESDCDPTDMLEEEDLEEMVSDHRNKLKRKHIEDQYESAPRKWFGTCEENKLVKAVLPIKGKKGIVPQFIEVKEDEQEEAILEEVTNLNENMQIDVNDENLKQKTISTVELYAQRNNKLSARKLKIASLATKVVENPQENIKHLKVLRLMMDEKDRDIFITVRKLVSVSLLEIFKDILPDYRIRAKSEKDTKVRLKKETKILVEYEDTLLRNYKGYLQRLEKMLEGLKSRKRKKTNSEYTAEIGLSMGELSVKCLCELLITRPSFNYRNNIIHLISPFANHPISKISDQICETFHRVFKDDKVGAVSLECVKAIHRLIKEKSFNVEKKVLDTFLSLRVRDIIKAVVEGKRFLTKKEKMQKLSRKDRKKSKQMDQLEKELLETKAEESKEVKSKFQTDVLSQVFLIYFKILKRETKSPMLPSVLEGLAKFSQLINVEFFDDLISVLHKLIESGELTYRENLHCVQTVFTILSGQGNALNVDPQRFYTHLYKHLFHFHTGISNSDIPTLLQCLDLMFVKRRKQVTYYRILAFIKRLSTISIQVNHDGCIALLMSIRILMQLNKTTDILLDTDNSQGNGVYLPELDEPEHCHANATSLYELHFLLKHYHPLVRQISNHILHGSPLSGEGQLPLEFCNKSPSELWNRFDSSQMEFKPEMLSPKLCQQGKKRKISSFRSGYLNEKIAKVEKELKL